MPSGRQIAYLQLCREAYEKLLSPTKPTFEAFEIQFRAERRRNLRKAAKRRYEATKMGKIMTKRRNKRYYNRKKALIARSKTKSRTHKSKKIHKNTLTVKRLPLKDQWKPASKEEVMNTEAPYKPNAILKKTLKATKRQLLPPVHKRPPPLTHKRVKPIVRHRKVTKMAIQKENRSDLEKLVSMKPGVRRCKAQQALSRMLPFDQRKVKSFQHLGR